MSRLLRKIAQHPGAAPALKDNARVLSYAELQSEVNTLAERLAGCTCLGILMDNHAAWVIADLAALSLGISCVPLPVFFSPEQIQHALRDAGVDILLSERPLPGVPHALCRIAGREIFLQPLNAQPAELPAHCAKITYTSGTTAQPKGVCLDEDAMLRVAGSIAQAGGAGASERHVCVLPLSLLLANISAVYAPLLLGACCHLPGLRDIGLQSGGDLDGVRLAALLHEWKADSTVLVPQMLAALLSALQAGAAPTPTLRFVAVGGAPLARTLLAAAAELHIPVFEGYGLSECASVVCMNTPRANRPGSVGRVLPHAEIRLAEDGELLVKGPRLQAYLHHDLPPRPDGFWPSGDFARIDEDGFVYLQGRKKTCFITAYGRNVAPEWVEQELCAQPAVARAVVYGEALPHNIALLQTRGGNISAAQLKQAVEQANQRLPLYAQVKYWRDSAEFYPEGLPLSPGGTPDRARIQNFLQGNLEFFQ